MENVSHAQNAKARARQQLDAGNLSKGDGPPAQLLHRCSAPRTSADLHAKAP